MTLAREAYDELYVYAMGRPSFLLQHVVDAFTAQTADQDTKPIATVFSLAGLYLYLEEGLSGHQVQKVHAQLAVRKREWPRVSLPLDRGAVTAIDVLKASAGLERDAAIRAWCQSVWDAYSIQRAMIQALLSERGIRRKNVGATSDRNA